ncbi:MAG: AAA family ATPase [Candidatus Ancillula trichonymphae]|jgi:chromosome partitioning protein|nr:AAA family ATPase [Candidatus Ancillula trichonymphae]
MKDIVGREYEDFEKPKPPKKHGHARIITMCNQKGGVGKTTSTINLGAAFAEVERKVLLVDFDPQGAASVGLGINSYDQDVTIYELLCNDEIDPMTAVAHTNTPNLDIIPANIELSAAEVQLVNEVARESILSIILEKLKPNYDLILIDCQPSLGLLTVNALTAADGVLIPLATEYFALRGVALLIDTIEKVRLRLNKSLQLDGIFATMFDSRTHHSLEVVESIYNAFGDKLLHTTIARTVKFPDSTVAAQPVTEFAPNHSSASSYRKLAAELIQRGALD